MQAFEINKLEAVAAIGMYGWLGGVAFWSTVGWHSKGFTCFHGAAGYEGFVAGAHGALPDDISVAASKAAIAPAKGQFQPG